MKLKHKIAIDFLNFFKTGKFDCLTIGKSKEYILNNFPDPDHLMDGDTFEEATIWRYGNIEMYFDKDTLAEIIFAHINNLEGGKNLELKKWILADTENLTLRNVSEALSKERIDFHVSHIERTYMTGTVLTLPKASIQMSFYPKSFLDGEENQLATDPNDYLLSAVFFRKV